MVIEAAVLQFAITVLASPPPQPAKGSKKSAPKVVQVVQVQRDLRFADFAAGVLKCYHPTARLQSAAIEQRPWVRQAQYEAKGSALVSIEYTGVTNTHYTMFVGVLSKPQAIKTVIQSDSAVVPAYEKCELADWVDVK